MFKLSILCVLGLGVAVFCASCHSRYLSCRSEYLYPRYLASERIDTPDPSRECYYGQQILVHWKLPRNLPFQPVTLILKVRYGDREIETYRDLITTPRGWKIHRLLNEEYWEKGGILSFQAQLLQNDLILDSWNHFLWVDLIEISPSSKLIKN